MNSKMNRIALLNVAALGAVGMMGSTRMFRLSHGKDGTDGTAPAVTKKWYTVVKDFMGKKANEKLEMEEAEAKTLVEGGFLKVCEEDPVQKLADDVLQKMAGKTQELVEDAVTKITSAFTNAKGKLPISTKERANEDNDWGYEGAGGFGEFARDVKLACTPGAPVVRPKLAGYVKGVEEASKKTATGMAVQNGGEEGGIFMLPTYSDKIAQKVFEESSLLNAVDTYNIMGNSIVFPRLKDDSRATGSRYGGVRAYWVTEGEKVNGSKPGFDRMQLTLKKLMALAYVTQEMLDDAGLVLEQFLIKAISDEMRFMLTDSLFTGNGVGMPLGFLNSAAKVTVAKELNQTAATVKPENLVKMYARIWNRSLSSGFWCYNQEVLPQLMLQTLSVGTGGSTFPVFMPPGGISQAPYGTIFGGRAERNEFCQALGTEGDICYVDPASYCFVTKGGFKTSMSMHLRFDYDENVYKITYRADGQPWWPKPLTPFRGTATVSPFVTLANR